MLSWQHRFRRPLLPSWLTNIMLLLILSGCSLLSTADNQHTDATRNKAGIRHFVDTWNNIHIFQTFDYNISNPSAAAKDYDFVWGAEPNHVTAWRSGNQNIFISYYISFNHDQGPFSGGTSSYEL